MDSLFYASSTASPFYSAAGLANSTTTASLPRDSRDVENELLGDFVVQSHLRNKHERKQLRRANPKLGPLGVSQSLTSLPTATSGANNKHSKPIQNQNQNQNQKKDGDDTSQQLQLDTSSVDDGDVRQMMGRVTFQGEDETEDSEAAAIEELAAHGREIQYTSMKDSVAINQIMREVLALHGTVDHVVTDAMKLMLKTDLASRVELANDKYVHLFERMLAEVLTMQREKFRANAKVLAKLQLELSQMRAKEAAGRDKVFEAKNAASTAEMAMMSMSAELANATREIERLNALVQELDKAKLAMQVAMDLNGRGIPEREVKKMIREARQQEIMKATKTQNDLRSRWIKETEMRIREAAEGKAGEEMSMAELAQQAKSTEDFKRPKIDGSSQTEVDEQGLWDKQDGWSLPVSGTLIARIRWRNAIKYARCPKCKGTGNFIGLCAKLLRALVRGVQVSDEEVPRGKTGSTWIMPDDLVRFMGNLPRSVQALRPKPLSWLLRRVYKLCDDKKIADDTDERLGYSLQSTPEFLIEHYLKLLPSRSEAEMALYEVFLALQEHYKSHQLLHTFARFVGILDGLSAEDMMRRQQELLAEKERKKAAAARESARGLGARAKAALRDKMKEEEDFLRERAAGKAGSEETLKVSEASLSAQIFSVYHYARSCLLEHYKGCYQARIQQIKLETELPLKYEQKFKLEADFPDIEIPPHVCIDKSLRFYVPYDRAVRVMSTLLSFLQDKQYQAALRSIEALCVFLNRDGSLYLVEGMHSLVRQTTREFMNVESPDGADLTFIQINDQLKAQGKVAERAEIEGPVTQEELERDRNVLMVDLDGCLRIVVECMLLRTSFVEKRLAEIFIEGDENGDGVLSFKEFTTIVAVVAPHFNERRIIRMFREALMLGNDDDSIGPKAFVDTCKIHGLVSLINVMDLRVGLLKALSLTDAEKSAKLEKETEEAEERAKQEASLFKSSFLSPSERRKISVLSRKGLDGGSLKKKPSMAALMRQATLKLKSTTTTAEEPSPGSSQNPSRINSPRQSETGSIGGDDYQPIRTGSAVSASQMALVHEYAQSAANTIMPELPSPIAEMHAEGEGDANPSAAASPYQSSAEVALLKDNVSRYLGSDSSPALGTNRSSISKIAEVEEDREEFDDDIPSSEGMTQAKAPLPAARAPEVPAPTVMAAPTFVSPVKVLMKSPSLERAVPAPAAPAAAASTIGVMPLVSRSRKDKPNDEVSRTAGLTVKDALRMRRESRLQARIAESSRLDPAASGHMGGMDDSDEDE